MIIMTGEELTFIVKAAIKKTLREEIKAKKLFQKLLQEDERLIKEWYCLAECAELKGVSAAYLRKHPDKQPGAGEGKRRICGLDRFHRSDVIPWLVMDDPECEAAEKIKEKSQRTA